MRRVGDALCHVVTYPLHYVHYASRLMDYKSGQGSGQRRVFRSLPYYSIPAGEEASRRHSLSAVYVVFVGGLMK